MYQLTHGISASQIKGSSSPPGLWHQAYAYFQAYAWHMLGICWAFNFFSGIFKYAWHMPDFPGICLGHFCHITHI